MTRISTMLLAAAMPSAAGLGAALLAPAVIAQTQTETAPALQTQTFAIENMTCPTCPITVKLAMSGLDGVNSVEVNLDAKTATVVFDPARVSPDDLAEASTNAGYPATLVES
ncbi:heavy-metal-associated domain-containing protein [Aurantimonas marianensis]|uniref:Heavy-metal-associated domain-containing protein n=1 Tax=Aurantimonas marianensis TaxID=2920428 RepID=A0A9X2HBC1_9HYPH|nr:heavy metal-associated domain-containing protein [Aurantimonas marianensis]MCP3056735.1 heavy-metal-associated domain-containing protein [Aurantimonas marianensis]